MTTCDECGVRVSATGYLGGGIVCNECAEARRTNDTDTLEARKKRYGGSE